MVIGIDCIGSCKSNYHTSTTAPLHHRRQYNKRANSYYKNIPFNVMLNVLDLSAVSWVRFLVGSNQIYLGICCFIAKYPSLKNRSKGWLAPGQDNVSNWSDIPSLIYGFWLPLWYLQTLLTSGLTGVSFS